MGPTTARLRVVIFFNTALTCGLCGSLPADLSILGSSATGRSRDGVQGSGYLARGSRDRRC